MGPERQATTRSAIKAGITVDVVQKQDQRSGTLTRGVVSAILTNSAMHPHGIKVRLTDGRVGRVQAIISTGADTGQKS
jgi:uncharacterized repeat protein (TIGR03833 family)